MPPPFINLEEDERVKETLTDPELEENTIKVPPPLVQKAKPPSLKNYMVHKRDPVYPNYPYPSRMNQEKQQEKNEMLKSLLSNKEKLLELANTPLNENFSTVILKKLPEKLGDPRKFLIPCSFSELKCKALANLGASINLIPLSMFTEEHALDYSSPPLWDDYDDELFDLETVNDNTYDDPFDSKEEKIKDSKILIDSLDPPGSSDFLPFPEYDSVFYEDFSEVDALPSTNNEDKVFNQGILIHENHFDVTNCETMEKNVKKTTNASLIREDFNPPLYELPFYKEVPGLGALLLFSSENKEKDMREADVILDIRFKHESNGIAISQSHYIENVLKKFNYFDCTLLSTPMDKSKKLMPNNGQAVSQLEYFRVIGYLMYAMTCTRPDITFVVGKLSRYTSNPGTQHWQAIQRISNNEDNSSTSCWVFLLGGGVISWASKKQTCITGSTMEYEFVALAAAGKEAEL
ncbi:hypothetical protein Tco_0829560 [Tanacetum coccineum]